MLVQFVMRGDVRRHSPSRTQSLVDLQRVFKEVGVEFISGPGRGPGARLWLWVTARVNLTRKPTYDLEAISIDF